MLMYSAKATLKNSQLIVNSILGSIWNQDSTRHMGKYTRLPQKKHSHGDICPGTAGQGIYSSINLSRSSPLFLCSQEGRRPETVQDYRGLNAGTIKKRSAAIDFGSSKGLSKGSIFTTLDLRSAYNLIRIKRATSGRQPGFASKGYSNNK
ncbi:hypothetical protein BASA83_009367 [Batrachochytrium salamandrivorans]|nr:hypothetical protein BASA83_009367 [Batrachochytrium salamandrivorans]